MGRLPRIAQTVTGAPRVAVPHRLDRCGTPHRDRCPEPKWRLSELSRNEPPTTSQPSGTIRARTADSPTGSQRATRHPRTTPAVQRGHQWQYRDNSPKYSGPHGSRLADSTPHKFDATRLQGGKTRSHKPDKDAVGQETRAHNCGATCRPTAAHHSAGRWQSARRLADSAKWGGGCSDGPFRAGDSPGPAKVLTKFDG